MSFLYRSRIAQYNHQLKKFKNASRNIGWSRVMMFVLIVAGIVLYWGQPVTLSIIIPIGLFLFFRLVHLNNKANDEVTYLNAIIEINRKEVKANEGKYNKFDAGREFLDHEHPYAYDFDLFEKYGLFQYINRTVSFFGKQMLAQWLTQPLLDREAIENRQEAIEELRGELDWRQDFLATGLVHPLDGKDSKRVNIWYKRKKDISNGFFYRLFLWLFPVMSLALTAMVVAGVIKWTVMFLFMFLPLAFVAAHLKQVNRQYFLISDVVKKLKVLRHMLKKIEEKEFKSALLKQWREELFREGEPASKQIAKLERLLNMFEQRQNMLVGFILNAFLLWDLHLIRKMNEWKRQHEFDLDQWVDTMARFDALISFGNFSFNHPELTYPEVSDEPFHFEAVQIGHPLIPQKERVNNDFSINGKGHLDIITGGNMAGKSTFLRTIGVNLVLAMAGAPVAAQKMVFSPMQLFSSMRTEDSLLSHSSYFYAELKRLSNLMQLVRSGENVFVILDEILKGTNSVDKAKGSRAFVESLVRYNVMGLLATHDLSLCELAGKYPEQITNYRFEVEFEGEEMKFDYKIRPGVCEHMNATALLKKMGIVENI